jgi:DNA-binding GntR family transcriptional regulator
MMSRDMPQDRERRTAFQEDTERVVRGLRHEIYSGLRLPRERLVENALAKSFSASRMVIRQVFRTLESEGLVEIEPFKGARVAAISLRKIHDTYQVLSMLEGFAARLAAGKMTGKDVGRLRRVVERQGALEAHCIREWQELNQGFHRIINLKCGNDLLIRLIRQQVQFTTYWFLVLSVPGRMLRNIDEHMKIIDALEKRDGDKAGLLMERHIMGAGEYLTENLQKALPLGMLG